MFKKGDIVRVNEKMILMHLRSVSSNKTREELQEEKYIVNGVDSNTKQLSMLDIDDQTIMRFGNFEFLEVISNVRTEKINKILSKMKG